MNAALMVPCPKCDAPMGQRCGVFIHAERKAEAKRAEAEEAEVLAPKL